MFEFDPRGDTILTLHNAYAPFAVWVESEDWATPFVRTPLLLDYYPKRYWATFQRLDPANIYLPPDAAPEYFPGEEVVAEEVPAEAVVEDEVLPEPLDHPANSAPLSPREHRSTASSPTPPSSTTVALTKDNQKYRFHHGRSVDSRTLDAFVQLPGCDNCECEPVSAPGRMSSQQAMTTAVLFSSSFAV